MKAILTTGAFSIALLCAPAALAAQDHGDVTLTLQTISGVGLTGQPTPVHDAACRAEYAGWIGRTVETSYTIDPQSLMMSASSTIEGSEVQLSPLGIRGRYVFMSDGVPPALGEQNVMRVLFQNSIGYDHPESRVITTLTDTVNCLIKS